MQLNYKIEYADFVEAQKLHLRKGVPGWRRALRLLVVWVWIIVLPMTVLLMFLEPERAADLVPLLLLGAFILFIFWLCPPLCWKRIYKKSKLGTQISADIGEDGIHFRSEYSDSLVRWNAFNKLLSSKSIFMLYFTDRLFYLLPKRAFAPTDIAVFRELTEQRIESNQKANT